VSSKINDIESIFNKSDKRKQESSKESDRQRHIFNSRLNHSPSADLNPKLQTSKVKKIQPRYANGQKLG